MAKENQGAKYRLQKIKSVKKSEGLWAAIQWWYANSPIVNIFYCAGAAVVIVGALAKIMHYEFLLFMLPVGMGVEAFLFLIGILEKPHATYHWENVHPELLLEHDAASGHTPATHHTSVGAAPQVQAVAGANALADEDVKALKDGIANLGKAANQLSQLSDVATATNGLVEKMDAAGAVAEQFATAQASLSTAAAGVAQQYQTIQATMEGVNAQTQSYQRGIEAVNGQLASLNSVYELQLKDLQVQAAAYKAQTEKVNSINATIDNVAVQANELKVSATAAVEAGKQYAAAQQKLAAQVADLNKVYGNMLNAL